MLVVVSVGLIAPPIGLDVYVVHNIAKTVPIGEIYRGIMPFLVSDVVRIAAVAVRSLAHALGGPPDEVGRAVAQTAVETSTIAIEAAQSR